MRETQSRSRPLARRLRGEMPKAELLLWTRLRRRQFMGLHFRRQHPIGPYIADFACVERRFVLEVDGATHMKDHEIAHDRRRTDYLQAEGWRVCRIWNHEVYDDLDAVLEGIAMSLPPPRPHSQVNEGGPPPQAGEE